MMPHIERPPRRGRQQGHTQIGRRGVPGGGLGRRCRRDLSPPLSSGLRGVMEWRPCRPGPGLGSPAEHFEVPSLVNRTLVASGSGAAARFPSLGGGSHLLLAYIFRRMLTSILISPSTRFCSWRLAAPRLAASSAAEPFPQRDEKERRDGLDHTPPPRLADHPVEALQARGLHPARRAARPPRHHPSG